MKDIVKHFFDKVDILQFIVGLFLLITFMAIVASLIMRAIPPENKEALIHVLGIMEGIITTIVTFYYGSSKGSQKKDAALAAKDEKPGIQITPEPGTNAITEIKTEH